MFYTGLPQMKISQSFGATFLTRTVCVWSAAGKRVFKPTFWRSDRFHGAWYLRHWQEHNSHGTSLKMTSMMTSVIPFTNST